MSDYKITGWDYTKPLRLGDVINWPWDSTTIATAYFSEVFNGQKGSAGHPFVRELKSHTGGAFSLIKGEIKTTPSSDVEVYVAGKLYYRGAFAPGYTGTPGFIGGVTNPSYYYNAAWNRARPAKPDFSGLNAVFELKDVPNQLKHAFENLFSRMGQRNITKSGRVNRLPSQAAEWHLAIQFGWLPLLSDVRHFVELQRTGQDKVNQLIKKNGRPQRRKGVLHTNSIESVDPDPAGNSDMHPIMITQAYDGPGSGKRIHSASETVSYAGRFTYWLPPGPQDVEWKNRILDRLYGNRVTPSVVYNAIPWTWLADWFSNLGDFMDAISPGVEDRLASDYFYVTVYQESKGTQSVQMNVRGPGGVLQSVAGTTTLTYKIINRAEGAGFAPELWTGTPTAMQSSILLSIASKKFR